MAGSPVNAMASDRRRFMPPEKVLERLFASPKSATASSRFSISAWRSASGTPFRPANNVMCSAATRTPRHTTSAHVSPGTPRSRKQRRGVPVRSSHSTSCCGHTPRFCRTKFMSVCMSLPNSFTVPDVAFSWPMAMDIVVVLPAPL